MAPALYLDDNLPRQDAELGHAKGLVGVKDVNEVVRNTLPFRHGWFGRTDIEEAVYQGGVGVNDLSSHLFGQADAQFSLSHSGRTRQNQERPAPGVVFLASLLGPSVAVAGGALAFLLTFDT